MYCWPNKLYLIYTSYNSWVCTLWCVSFSIVLYKFLCFTHWQPCRSYFYTTAEIYSAPSGDMIVNDSVLFGLLVCRWFYISDALLILCMFPASPDYKPLQNTLDLYKSSVFCIRDAEMSRMRISPIESSVKKKVKIRGRSLLQIHQIFPYWKNPPSEQHLKKAFLISVVEVLVLINLKYIT